MWKTVEKSQKWAYPRKAQTPDPSGRQKVNEIASKGLPLSHENFLKYLMRYLHPRRGAQCGKKGLLSSFYVVNLMIF